jgi:hypothetical protein
METLGLVILQLVPNDNEEYSITSGGQLVISANDVLPQIFLILLWY